MRTSARPSFFALVIGLCLTAGLVLFLSPATANPEQFKLTASDGIPSDRFGIMVAVSGDTAVVGAPFEGAGPAFQQGAAYVFVRSGRNWVEQAKLTASDGSPLDKFGFSVAISGDTVVAGAYHDEVGINALQGSAYVFTRTGGVWREQAKLTASDGAINDTFGHDVAVSGDTVLIGASQDDIGPNADQGSAYVFTRTGDEWTQQDQLVATDGGRADLFGFSVATSGDTAVIGAEADDIGTNVDQGSAYVFTRTGNEWTQQTQLLAREGAGADEFGFSVAVSDDASTAVVGAVRDDIGANVDQGSAYVFVRTGDEWPQQVNLTAPDGAAGDVFGRSVAASENMVLVGAQGDEGGPNLGQGSAHTFTLNGGTWTHDSKLTAADPDPGSLFGVSVGLSGATAIVGAGFADVGLNIHQGAAYIFDFAKPSPALTVNIDVKPGDNANRIRTSSNEGIAVAILTDETFDASTVDPSTVCFGDEPPPGGTNSYAQPPSTDADCSESHRKGHVEDVDGDGDLDMILHFETGQTGIDSGDTKARLTGRTKGGTAIEGSDSIRTVR